MGEGIDPMDTSGRAARAARSDLPETYQRVRGLTEQLASPLSAEDQTVQTMPDVSPTKWHRAHATWFFETFVLAEYVPRYEVYDDAYAYIFNSYYEAVGARHPRPERGLLSRPGIAEVAQYRAWVDCAMEPLLSDPAHPGLADLITLGLHHEQQHQELLLMDIKHVLSCNPLHPAYLEVPPSPTGEPAPKAGWLEHGGGPVEIGHHGGEFGFDNEFPLHTVHLTPFGLADRPVTCGEWLAFMHDDGYRRPELWLSDGWAVVNAARWDAPMHWSRHPDDPERWLQFTLSGLRPVDPDEPVCHVSYYEADAFAHWTGMRLPTESEWETIALEHGEGDNLLGEDTGPDGRPVGVPHPRPPWTRTHCSGTSGSGPRAPTRPTRASAPRRVPSASTTASSW